MLHSVIRLIFFIALLGTLSGNYISPWLYQTANKKLSDWITSLSQGKIQAGEFKIRYQDFSLRLEASQITLKTPSGVKVDAPIESLQFGINFTNILKRKQIQLENLYLDGLTLEINSDEFSKTNQTGFSDTDYCKTLNNITRLIEQSHLSIDMNQVHIRLILNKDFPLSISLLKADLKVQDSTESCHYELTTEVSLPQFNKQSLTIKTSLINHQQTFLISSKTQARDINLESLNAAIFRRYLPDISKELSQGEVKNLDLNFNYFPKNSRFLLNGRIKNAQIKVKSIPTTINEIAGDFTYEPHLFSANVYAATTEKLALSDTQIDVPIGLPQTNIKIKGTLQGDPNFFTQFSALKTYGNFFRIFQNIKTQGQVTIQLPKNSSPLVSGKVQFNKIELDNPFATDADESNLLLSGHFQLEKSQIKNGSFDIADGAKHSHFYYSRDSLSKHRIQLSGELDRIEFQKVKDLIASLSSRNEKPDLSQPHEQYILINGSIQISDIIFGAYHTGTQEFIFKSNNSISNVSTRGQNITGNLQIFTDFLSNRRRAIKAHFQKIHLIQVNSPSSNSPQSSTEENFDPNLLPELEFFCNSLRIGPKDIGAVTIRLETSQNGAIAKELIIQSKGFTLWSENATWKKNQSLTEAHLVAEIKIHNLDLMMKQLELPSELGEANGQVLLNLHWMNSLLPKADSLKGKVNFSLDNGKVASNWSPFQTLLKLVSLDIGSIFGSDYSFKRFFGEINLNGNRIDLVQVKLKLQPATFQFRGNIQIPEKLAHLDLEVTPKITNSIIGLALSPILFAMSELNIKRAWINRAFSHQYKVEGTLQKLDIRFHKMGRLPVLD